MSRPSKSESESVPLEAILRGYAVLAAVGAIAAYAAAGRSGVGTYVDVLVPTTVVVSLFLLAWRHQVEG